MPLRQNPFGESTDIPKRASRKFGYFQGWSFAFSFGEQFAEKSGELQFGRSRKMDILLVVDTTVEGASPSHARQE
jgi:hypothetical protein